jgi:formylglycine-generating enzyme required for sulfatase activity
MVHEIAWFYPNSGYTTNPVGTKKENELGIVDMSGNVWEWCQNDYRFYNHNNESFVISSKVIRGGSFRDFQSTLRVYNRSKFYPLSKANDIGFRCVKDADK